MARALHFDGGMKNAHPSTTALEAPAIAPSEPVGVLEYYQQATEDYAAWSSAMHMHFGYWRPGLGLLDREAQLAEMSRQVLQRLGVRRGQVADLGCGVGASSRLLARERPEVQPVGVSLVPEQIERAQAMARAEGSHARFICADYTNTPFLAQSFDGAFALESACHAPGPDKEAFLREAARVLKPGARLVVADGFLRKAPRPGPWRALVNLVAHNWAVKEFAQVEPFVAALERSGFEEIEVEDISLRLAPSAAHIPLVTLGFLWRSLRAEGLRLSRARWGHLAASLASMLVGLMRPRFGYFIVRARKR